MYVHDRAGSQATIEVIKYRHSGMPVLYNTQCCSINDNQGGHHNSLILQALELLHRQAERMYMYMQKLTRLYGGQLFGEAFGYGRKHSVLMLCSVEQASSRIGSEVGIEVILTL